MLKSAKLGFIGSGKMAEAIIKGVLDQRVAMSEQIIATGPRTERGAQLATRYSIATSTDNLQAAISDVIVISVKPQMWSRVASQLRDQVSKRTLIISIMAGVSIMRITKTLGHEGAIVRAMPNTPGAIGRGTTVWCANNLVTGRQKEQAAALLGALGVEKYVDDERYINMATAVSGSGPAYTFLFMEALVDAAVRCGLGHDMAEQLVIETVQGSVEYAKQAGKHLAQLRNDVTSPAGTSAEALYVLEEAGFRSAILRAVTAAYLRARELGK